MNPFTLTKDQQRITEIPINFSVFLEGEAGNGKTTCAVSRFLNLLEHYPGHQVLVMVPQHSLGNPYIRAFNQMENYSGSIPSILTFGSLARRMVSLFWPLVSKDAGFQNPEKSPKFLSTETAQYCMGNIIAPRMDEGFFQSVVLTRNRLYSQILDNLNKSAIIRIPIEEIASRLKSVANLDVGLSRAYDQVVVCAREFREFCLSNSLMDYSLQIEVFINHLWQLDICRNFLLENYKALIFDNFEEDVPAAHDVIKEWLPDFESSLVVYDRNGGYRSFLGADPESARSIKPLFSIMESLNTRISETNSLMNFSIAIHECILHENNSITDFDFINGLRISDYHFYPEMIEGVCRQIKELVNSNIAKPEDIVILSPYLSDALNFSLSASLDLANIPHRTSRPSRTYYDDPAVHAFLTFAKIAHPQWQMNISFFEMRNALIVMIPGLDIVKADLIVRTLFSVNKSQEGLRSFNSITNPIMQERISFQIGEKLERIRIWLEEYKSRDPQPLDVFFSMLFGELFSQKGFNLFTNYNVASRIFQISQSIQSFRIFLTQVMGTDEITAGLEYIKSIENGLLPSSIFRSEEISEDSILIAPAHTFLMENRQVDFQFWLDIGSLGWWERLNQPLTNPYLINRNRDTEQLWTESFEYDANQSGMLKIIDGLINRCGKTICVNTVQTNEYGSEQKGPLLRAFNILQKRVYHANKVDHV